MYFRPNYQHPFWYEYLVHVFHYSTNISTKKLSLYIHISYTYLGLGFEFGPKIIRDLSFVCPQSVAISHLTIYFLFFQECLNKWDQIPDDTDILISHTPPVGYGDLCCTGVRAGCVELLNTVRLRVRPKVPIHKLRKQKLGILFFQWCCIFQKHS